MKFTINVWRQSGPKEKGGIATYKVNNISDDMSFLEMIDVLNEQLIIQDIEPVVFDHDCLEGICGRCSMFIN